VLGALCGDVLGIPAEAHHMTSRQIKTQYGELRDFIPATCLGLPRNVVRLGSYSDDTNSSLALATSLARCGGLDAAHVARTYGSFWLKDPERGYPESAKMSMVAVQLGVDPILTGRLAFPDGSFANGGAMRIAPVGIAFRRVEHTRDRTHQPAGARAVPREAVLGVRCRQLLAHLLHVSPSPLVC